MKVIIEAEPKEIAALVLEIQERQSVEFVPRDGCGITSSTGKSMSYGQFINSHESNPNESKLLSTMYQNDIEKAGTPNIPNCNLTRKEDQIEKLREKAIAALKKQIDLLDKDGISALQKETTVGTIHILTEMLKSSRYFQLATVE